MLLSPKEAIQKLLLEAPAISAIVGAKLYPGIAPQGVNFPYGLYSRLSDGNDKHMGGSSGLKRARVQVEWFGLEATVVEDLAAAMEEVLEDYEGPVEIGDRSLHFDLVSKEEDEDEDNLVVPEGGKDAPAHTRRQVYEAWYREADED